MSNIVRLHSDSPKEEWLTMSNLGTDCFLEVLLVSSSAIDNQTAPQKALIEWLAEKRAINEYAPGTIDFKISEMPWSASSFKEDKKFLCEVIDAALNHNAWDTLGYTPNAKIVDPRLQRFREFVSEFEIDLLECENDENEEQR